MAITRYSTWWFWFHTLDVVYWDAPLISFSSFTSFYVTQHLRSLECIAIQTHVGKGWNWRWFTIESLFISRSVQTYTCAFVPGRNYYTCLQTSARCRSEYQIWIHLFPYWSWLCNNRMWCHALMMIINISKFMHFFSDRLSSSQRNYFHIFFSLLIWIFMFAQFADNFTAHSL